MNAQSYLTFILTTIQGLFAKNLAIQEIVPLLEAAYGAFESAKAGQAWSISFPEAIDGKPGMTTLAWSPAMQVSSTTTQDLHQ
jgi:hypothetical protein